jgi:paraquat-inducible protein B
VNQAKRESSGSAEQSSGVTTANGDTHETATESTPTFPMAVLRSNTSLSRWFASRFWWLTLICGIISIGLFWFARRSDGDLITIAFQDGHGLKLEDRLNFRGIDIGSVEKIELSSNRDSAMVHVRMSSQARPLAAEGAKFWVVRPLVSFDSIQGLETLLGAKYISIEPPPTGAKLQSHFVGLDSAPIVAPAPGSLEITLDGIARGGLENGAPILFRGFRIGNVVHVGLASDARSVRARCSIDSDYRELVRKNTKFWNRSGWRLDIGLAGIKLDADSFSQIVLGGIEMATPTEPASAVNTGHGFVLHEKPEAEWLTWKPSLAHGKAWANLESQMPQPIRIALRWQERSFGFRKNQQKSAWCLPLNDGSTLCLSEQMSAPKSALPDSTQIEFAGMSVKPDQVRFQLDATSPMGPQPLTSVVRFSTEPLMPNEIAKWPVQLVEDKLPRDLCDVVIAHADSDSILAIDAARLKIASDGWEIEDTLTLEQDFHGLPVVSATTNHVIGLISISKGKCWIVNRE